jgi:hypothetical protein
MDTAQHRNATKVRERDELGRSTGITRSGHVTTLQENRSTALVP